MLGGVQELQVVRYRSIEEMASAADLGATMRFSISIVTLVLLAACSGDQKVASTAEKKTARAAKAQQVLSQPATQTIHHINGNQLIVIDFPVRMADDFADMKRCFVWRDEEFKTSSLSCEQEDTSSGVTDDR